MFCLIDNYDSFTYNIVQYLFEFGIKVWVVKNDELELEDIVRNKVKKIVISPGPCTPNESGISIDVLRRFGGEIPILGICLGHEVIAHVFGGNVVHAKSVMHGKVSKIYHTGQGVFQGLPNPFNATRYHSLVVDSATFPDVLEITAWTQCDDGQIEEIMGLRHRRYDIEGVQFHPEAILTEYGHELLRNFVYD